MHVACFTYYFIDAAYLLNLLQYHPCTLYVAYFVLPIIHIVCFTLPTIHVASFTFLTIHVACFTFPTIKCCLPYSVTKVPHST